MKLSLPLSNRAFDKKLDKQSIARLDLAIELYKKGDVDGLILTGGFCEIDETSFTHASLMVDYALSTGIPPERLYVDFYGLETIGKIFFANRNIISKQRVDEIILITHSYNLELASEIIHFIIPDKKIIVKSLKTDVDNITKLNEKRSIELFHHIMEGINAGDTEQIAWALINRHPLYDRESFVRVGVRKQI